MTMRRRRAALLILVLLAGLVAAATFCRQAQQGQHALRDMLSGNYWRTAPIKRGPTVTGGHPLLLAQQQQSYIVALLRQAGEKKGRDRNVPLPPPDKWSRPYYRPGGGNAYACLAVFGDFAQPFALRLPHYHINGIPDGVELLAYTRADHKEVVGSFYRGWLRESLKAEQPDLFAAVERAPMCLLIRGTVADPPTLHYLRDIIGIITALCDKGAVAVLDTQAVAWFAPKQWRERIYAPGAPVPTHHVTVLISPEEDGQHVWVHTRGMRKFGRPDLSVRGVTRKFQETCVELCNRFIEMQAFGEVVPEGQPIRMRGLPPGMTCHRRGDYADLDFNNVHIEIRMPE